MRSVLPQLRHLARELSLLKPSSATDVSLVGLMAEHEIAVAIRDGHVDGEFPRRARAHVLEWLELHRDELLANWDRARAKQPLTPIAPLE